MKQNVGGTDRIVRIVIAAVLLAVAWMAGFGSVAGIVMLVLAIVLAATSAMSFCPLYLPFGLSTRKRAAS